MADFLAEAEEVAVEAAKEAGKLILAHFRKILVIEIKKGNPRNLVTNADKESDKLIKRLISGKFPEHGIVSEESEPTKGEYVWYIDPIDGTTNYSRGVKYFCVSIALAKDDDLLVAAVYNPATSELYTAVKGRGAFLNGKKLVVFEPESFDQAMIYGDLGYETDEREKALAILKFLVSGKGLRVKGSGALAMCELAAGHADAYVDLSSTSWDYAAAALLVREAGGTVADFSGKDWSPQVVNGIVAGGSKQLCGTVLEKVRLVLK